MLANEDINEARILCWKISNNYTKQFMICLFSALCLSSQKANLHLARIDLEKSTGICSPPG